MMARLLFYLPLNSNDYALYCIKEKEGKQAFIF